MRHARDDYNRIQDPDNLIPDDEPVMLFRAQDELYSDVLEYYAGLLLTRYGEGKRAMADVVLDHAVLGDRWANKKQPDLKETA